MGTPVGYGRIFNLVRAGGVRLDIENGRAGERVEIIQIYDSFFSVGFLYLTGRYGNGIWTFGRTRGKCSYLTGTFCIRLLNSQYASVFLIVTAAEPSDNLQMRKSVKSEKTVFVFFVKNYFVFAGSAFGVTYFTQFHSALPTADRYYNNGIR